MKPINPTVMIRGLLPSMSKVNKIIGEYILAHPDEVITSTTSILSKNISVSEGSIIGFCRMLNYTGFTTFKISLAQSLQNTTQIQLDDIALDKNNLNAKTVLNQVFSSVCTMLTETSRLIDTDELEKAVEMLCSAKKIEFYGVGTSATIAQDAYYRFMRIGLPAQACVDPHIMKISANLLNENCVAIGISHTGKTNETIEALRTAKEKHAKTICITSFFNSPITTHADVKLVTSTQQDISANEAISSRIAHIALLDTLYACVSLKDYKSTQIHINQMHEILSNMRK